MTTLETLRQGLHERPLPAGWRMVRLGELIAEAQAGFASGERDSDGVIQLRMNNVDTRGNLVWDEVLRVPADAATIDQYRLIPGDVMFNNTNSTELVGKSALFEGYDEPVVFSNHFTRIRPKPGVLLPDFLAAWLNHQWLKGVFASICNQWIGQSAVKGDRLLKLDFPLPPLREQKRIAATLREQMAEVEKARAAAQTRLDAANLLPAAFMRQYLEDGESRRWPHVGLGSICTIDARQIDPKLPEYRDLPHVNGENIESGTGRLFGIKSAAEDRMTSGKYLFDAGVVLYSKLRPYLRKVALADFRGLCSADMYPLSFDPARVDRRFSLWVLLAKPFTDYAVGESQRARMPKLNRDQLFAWQFPLPSMEQQRRVAEALERHIDGAQTLTKSLLGEQKAIDDLGTAMLRRAFTEGI